MPPPCTTTTMRFPAGVVTTLSSEYDVNQVFQMMLSYEAFVRAYSRCGSEATKPSSPAYSSARYSARGTWGSKMISASILISAIRN